MEACGGGGGGGGVGGLNKDRCGQKGDIFAFSEEGGASDKNPCHLF